DQFRARRRTDQNRSGPTHLDLARRLPHFFAGLLIKRNDERGLAIFFVTLHDHEILEQDWRRSRSHADCAKISELRFPRQIAFEVVRVKTFSAEKRIDEFAISRRS